MKTIYKYQIEISDYFTIAMPEGSEILKVGVQNNIGTMWVMVTMNVPFKNRNFSVIRTGQQFSLSGLEYLGTFEIFNGSHSFVGHLFEIT